MERELQLETCHVDLDRRLVIREGDSSQLTEQEAMLLEYLAARAGRPVPREELLKEVWGFAGKHLVTRAVDVAVRRLRTKLESDPGNPDHILTVRHVGYRFQLGRSAPRGGRETLGPPMPRPRPPRRAALPAERTRILGRSKDLQTLIDALDAGRRLVTVVGPPGVGKTRVALRLGHRLEAGGARVVFVDLAPALTGAQLVQRLANALGVPLAPEAELSAHRAQLGRALGEAGPLVLILDNMEQLLPEVGQLEAWLDAAPAVAVVATSRARLRVAGEQAVALEPLDRETAVALFLERAQAAHRDYGNDDPEAVEQIVLELDGLPLAIELAAARASVLAPSALLAGMKERFRLLGGVATEREHGGTLHGALDWSWSLLTDMERRALAQLSVFEASFSVDAVERVVQLDGADWALDWLQGLADKSLIRALHAEGAARFELLRSQRAFALQQLDGLGLADATRDRHARHVLAWGAEQVAALHSADGKAALGNLWLLAEDIRAVHRRSIGREPDHTIRSAELLDRLLESTGPLHERLAAIEAALLVARAPLDRSRLLLARARIRSLRSEQETAAADIEAAAALAEGDPGLAARIEGHHAWLLEQRSAYAEATESAQWSLELAREARDPLTEARALDRLSQLAALAGDRPAAEAHCRAMQAIGKALGSAELELRARMTLGLVARSDGRLVEAERQYRGALTLARDARDPTSEATLLGILGAVAAGQSRIRDAIGLFESAMRGHRAIGNVRLETQALGNLGTLLMADGRLREARARLVEATEMADPRDSPRHLGMVEGNLGVCLVQLGELDDARRHLQRATELMQTWGSPFAFAYFSLHEGIVLADLDRPDEAVSVAARADEGLGEHPVAMGLRAVARGHVHHARARRAMREGASAAEALSAYQVSVATAEKIAVQTRDLTLSNALNAVLPSELVAALRNLRRTAAERRVQ